MGMHAQLRTFKAYPFENTASKLKFSGKNEENEKRGRQDVMWPAVNFINFIRARFLYERHSGSFFHIYVTYM